VGGMVSFARARACDLFISLRARSLSISLAISLYASLMLSCVQFFGFIASFRARSLPQTQSQKCHFY
jgi:hypothetical protein